MSLYVLASIAGGIVMGLWLDRLVGGLRSAWPLIAGVAALGGCFALGQEWAGIALGCALGARLVPVRPSEG